MHVVTSLTSYDFINRTPNLTLQHRHEGKTQCRRFLLWLLMEEARMRQRVCS